MHDTQKIINLTERLANLATPPPNLEPWEWAEKHIYLPPSQAAAAGHYDISKTPWIKDVTEAVKNPAYKRVIMVFGSQLGKTTGGLFVPLLWRMSTEPTPTMYFTNTESSVMRMSARFGDIIAASPLIKKQVSRRKDTRNTYFFNNVPVYFLTAGSKDNVASTPAGLCLFDEAGDVKNIHGQGNPFFLVEIRGSTFQDFCLVACGSPALGQVTEYIHPETKLIHWASTDLNVQSLIWKLWQETTRSEYMLPCPSCNIYFTPKSKLLVYPESCKVNKLNESNVKLKCPHCAAPLEQKWQYEMIQNGKLISPGQYVEQGEIIGEGIQSEYAGFYVNGLCSFFENWVDRGKKLIMAERDSTDYGRFQATLNTQFGECYYRVGEVIDWQIMAEKREDSWRMREIPEEIQSLTAFIDVHGTHLDCVTMGWSHNQKRLEGWVVEHKVWAGNTYETKIWEQLDQYLTEPIEGLKIEHVGIDAGFNPSKSRIAKLLLERDKKPSRNILYDFVRNHFGMKMTKGSSHELSKRWQKSVTDVTTRGRQKKKGLGLWILDTNFFKNEIFISLNRDNTHETSLKPPGSWHFPTDLPDSFFKQIANEYFDNDTLAWVQTGENHALDCLVGNLFLALERNFARKLPLRKIDTELEQINKKQEKPEKMDNWNNDASDDW